MSLTGQLKVYLNGRRPTYGEEYSMVPRQLLYAAIKKLEEQDALIQHLQESQSPPEDDLPPAA